MKELSVVIPIFNSALRIEALVSVLEHELKNIQYDIILVNDGSKDDSESVCLNLAKNRPQINTLSLSKNFGEFNAVMCGLNYAKGKYVVVIDDDFQNPPSEILRLLECAYSGDHDVVYSYYSEKKHSILRKLGSFIINYFATYLLKKPKDLYLSSFKLLSQDLVVEIIKFKTPYPYLDGIIFFLTDRIGKLEVIHNAREDGQSGYTIRKLISLVFTVFFGYSLLPLRIIMSLGVLSIFLSLTYMGLYFFDIIPEWGSPVIIFFCGVILCSLALVGEYVGKTFMLLNGNPQYLVRKKIIK